MIHVLCCTDAAKQEGRPDPGTKFGMGYTLNYALFFAYVLFL